MKVQTLAALTLFAAFAAPSFAEESMSGDAAKATEKCYGVAATGKNDCASEGNNSCAGTTAKDSDGKAWILVPAGLCEKLTGGSLEPKA
jgi:uncharacterized membrane protein